MTLEEYLGKECALAMKELFAYAVKLDSKERKTLIEFFYAEAASRTSNNVRMVLVQMAKHIESMKNDNALGDVK